MGRTASLETDYLVVGAGALGMGFVDTLLDGSDADVVMVDRRHRPGGHWVDAYPFVRLHQPSMNYGVNSTPLGKDRIETEGRDAGFYERADGAEICAYYDEIMRERFLASNRVRFFPMSDYLGGGSFRSRLTDDETSVSVRARVVDATYMASRIPATDPPPFVVGDGATCVPVAGLVDVTQSPDGYVIIGGGKTAMDAACWLLDRGVAPDDITWIRPRESWLLNRAFFQPDTGVLSTLEGIVHGLEAVEACDTVEAVFEHLRRQQVMVRLDPSSEPSMTRGATVSLGELGELQRIEHVVRLGHVEAIGRDVITLEHGSIPTSPGRVHVHCASPGLSDNPPRSIFGDDGILLQPVTRASLSLSAGLLGVVEASSRSTAEKNRLCPPNAWFDTPFDWIRHLLTGMRTELEWRQAPDVRAWVDGSRLNLMKGIDDDPDRARTVELQGRFVTALFPALAKLDSFAPRATPAERQRMTDPIPE